MDVHSSVEPLPAAQISKKSMHVARWGYKPAAGRKLIPCGKTEKSKGLRSEEELISAAERLGLLTRTNVLGCFHWLPKGETCRSLIQGIAEEFPRKYGAERLSLSRIFRLDGPDDGCRELVARFKAEIFPVGDPEQERFLCYASDPSLFRLLSGKAIAVPYRTFSPGYFYRNEESGNVKPITRPREFYMNDFHFFGAGGDLAEFEYAALMNAEAMRYWFKPERWRLNVDTNEAFLKTHEAEILGILERVGAPADVNVTAVRTHYYDLQFQYCADYFAGNSTQICNLQFDTVNGERFSIRDKGAGNPVAVIHGTVCNRPEKILAYYIGEALEERSKKPMLPVWLSPTMVRVTSPAPEIFSEPFVQELFAQLRSSGVRFDYDPSGTELRKQILKAEKEWIPIVLIVGRDEVTAREVKARIRSTGEQPSLSVERLLALLAESLLGRPTTAQNVSERLDQRVF